VDADEVIERGIWGIKAVLILAVVFASFKAGQWLGEINSPNYGDEWSAARFILTNAHPRRTANGEYVVTLSAGPEQYRYDFGSNRLTRRTIMADLSNYRPPRRWVLSETNRLGDLMSLSAIVPGGAVASISIFGRARAAASGAARWRIYAAIGLAALLGGWLGYYLSYEDTFDYTNPTFRRVAADRKYYHYLAYQFARCDSIVRGGNLRFTSPRVQENWDNVRARCQEALDFLDEPLGES
jgi:hypothetical protein